MGSDLTLSQAQLARVFRVSTRTIQRWDGLGLQAARTADVATAARYFLPSAVAWRLDEEARRLLEARSRNGDGPSLEEARARKEWALAQLREVDLAERRGELVYREHHREVVVRLASGLRNRLLALPSRWARDVAGLTDLRDVAGVLQKAVREVLQELTDAAEEIVRSPSGPLPPDFPERAYLAAAGVDSWEELREAAEALEGLPGIGRVRANRIREALAGAPEAAE